MDSSLRHGGGLNNYLLLARGESLETAQVLAVSANPEVVNGFIRELVGESKPNDKPQKSEQHESLRLVERDEE
jgi:hypothetical protein